MCLSYQIFLGFLDAFYCNINKMLHFEPRYIYGTFGVRGQALQSVTSKDGLLRGVILYDFKSNWWFLYPDKAIFAGHMRKPADPYAT